MIASLSGKLIEKKDSTIVIDVHGVGYEVSCSPRTVQNIAEVGGAIQLSTFAQYRADGATLFGFASPHEKALFLELVKVDSVGPKSALNILNAANWDELIHLIEDGDVSALSKLPKITKKTAEHVVVKLKGKLAPILLAAQAIENILPVATDLGEGVASGWMARRKTRAEAQAVLSNLGYRPHEVQQTLDGLDENVFTGELEGVIRQALNSLAGGSP